MRRQFTINFRFCYSARRATNSMSTSRMRLASPSLPTFVTYLQDHNRFNPIAVVVKNCFSVSWSKPLSREKNCLFCARLCDVLRWHTTLLGFAQLIEWIKKRVKESEQRRLKAMHRATIDATRIPLQGYPCIVKTKSGRVWILSRSKLVRNSFAFVLLFLLKY